MIDHNFQVSALSKKLPILAGVLSSKIMNKSRWSQPLNKVFEIMHHYDLPFCGLN